MYHRTCHRLGYKLLTPEPIWELFDGLEFKGFVKNFDNEPCDPPKYTVIGSQAITRNIMLPKEAEIIFFDPFPAGLQGPEVNEISDTKEEQIEDLWDKVKAQEAEIGGLEVEIQQLNIKLKHQKPSGSIRWKLTYTWCYGTEVHWDFKTKKQAVAFMEENIKDFFGTKIVESIKDVKYDKYIYGQRVKQDETNVT